MFRQIRDAAAISLSLTGNYHNRYRDIWLKRAKWAERENKILIPQWSRENKALFVHVPKAAGSSLKTSLFGGEIVEAHCPASAYREIDPEFYEQAFVFSFVRNPWDRLVSAFHHVRFKDSPYNRIVTEDTFKGIDDFDTFLDRLRGLSYRHRILTRLHFMPQTSFVCDASGQIIVDKIGRFEQIEDEYRALSAHFPTPESLIKVNTGKRASKDHRTYYKNDWAIELVGSMYAEDCDLFDYSFE